MFSSIIRTQNLISRIFHDRSRFLLIKKNILPINNTQINDFSSKSMKVAILGARSKIGNCLSLFLKQSPLIDELAIFDNNSSTYGLALDLNYIDTKCKVSTCNHPDKCLEETLQGAKIVMIVTDRTSNPSNEVLRSNAIILSDLLPNIIKFAPQAMLGIVMNPINSLIPLTTEMYKKAGIYEYNRIFGVMNFECLKANSFTADLINIEPECTMIPVIGGGCSETCIPLFSQAKPSNKISQVEARRLTYAIRMSNNTLNPHDNKEKNSFALSYAAARFCMSLCKALRHQGNVVECAYVRSCAIPELTYFAAPLELGPNGIQRHLDIPPLNDYECELLRAAVPRIKKDIKLGENLALGNDTPSSELCLNNLMPNSKCFS
ncbi:probable malate dehydrogenase, mitochondrial [Apis florea]|uniref:probable malate dehydrogenase, mitochondrial n=1 Tax=Apis florea TaxID=7463 RepID=UPI000629C927|nr:probable malate dehydrogenase, mitochondrial [Apis florea]